MIEKAGDYRGKNVAGRVHWSAREKLNVAPQNNGNEKSAKVLQSNERRRRK